MSIEIKSLIVSITEGASEQIRNILASQELTDLFLRIYVQGGCSGIGFGMALDNKPIDGDTEYMFDDIKVVVDRNSLPYVNGAEVDFTTENGKTGFRITNPNVDLSAGSCGSGSCGTGGGCGSGCSC
ncbi:MAG: iron-sulfur cluster assembly accessory protein [Candidatus Heimdallarchaeota archaeon]|nr:iron-sulfur cluster assembly accessory protein [Candidatus Heimdallarchaeota archaeon]